MHNAGKLCRVFRSGIFLLIMLAAPSYGVTPGSELQFKRLLSEQGVFIGAVQAVHHDSEGYMWFGGDADTGLAQHDGYNFTIHRREFGNPRSLSSGVVWDIHEDQHGVLWIATDAGLNRFDRDTGQFTRFAPDASFSAPAHFMRQIVEDAEGQMWVASFGGLLRFDPETGEFQGYFYNPDDENTLSALQIRSLLADRTGGLWVGTDRVGLNYFDVNSAKVQRYPFGKESPDSTLGSTVLSLHQTAEGVLWVGTDAGLSRLDPATNKFQHFTHDSDNPDSLSENIVTAIAEDEDGNLWLGTEGGLNYLARGTERFVRYLHNPNRPRSMATNTLHSLHFDTNQNLWIGHFPTGVSYLDSTNVAFSTYGHNPENSNSLNHPSVLSLREDPKGNLWLGTDGGGLNYFDRTNARFSHYPYQANKPGGLSAAAILSIEQGEGNLWWLGTWGGGINLFDAETGSFQHYSSEQYPLLWENVWALTRTRDGTLWVGSIGAGAQRYDADNDRFIRYEPDEQNPDPNGMRSFVVWAIYEDHLGNIWFGTGDGLARYRPETDDFETLVHDPNDPNSLSADVVTHITEDSQNRLWVATRGGGLNLYDRATKTFSHIDEDDGLPSNVIVSVVPDNLGNLWLGTTNGISRYTPSTGKILNYNQQSGLQGNQFNIGSGVKLDSGELVFGGIYGFTLFNPEDLQSSDKVPPVAIVGFEIFNQPVPVGGRNSPLSKAVSQTESITLTYKQSVFTFTFAALSYSNPEKNQYAYMLEGFEDQWNYVGNRRNATYTNLDAGRYVFRVKAANSQGIWNEQGRSIHIHILPPPWKTWWAYTLYFLLVAGLIYIFVREQRKKVIHEREISNQLEIQVAQRTEDLRKKNQELEEAYQQLENISLSDPLTGLSNRRYLQKLIPMDIAKVQRELRNTISKIFPLDKPGQDMVFLLLDVDHFKPVNDIHGHAAGDQVLIQLSRLLTQISRDSDCLVRWGGEEFLIVARFSCRTEAPEMAERIRLAVEEFSFTLPDGQTIKKTCSIGYACYPFLREIPEALSWEQVIDTADRALYIAKNSGRNRCVGLVATDATPQNNLYLSIREDTKGMIARGELQILAADRVDIVSE